MASITKSIGLSLGADLCWPACYEEMVRRLAVTVPAGPDDVSVAVERITVEPFDLRQPCKYDVVLDRLTHWFHTSREWIKKAVIMDDLYVLNNPWSLQSMEKHTSYCAMMRLGMPVPDTWLIPPKAHEPSADLQPTLERYARMFDLGAIGDSLGYPLFMKPYDGGAWVGVTRLDDADALRAAYEDSGTRVMHLQHAVLPHDLFVRCIGVGPQVHIVKYDPAAPLHARYLAEPPDITDDERALLIDTTLTINAFFGWEFNSCEALRQGGVFHPIDFANACPDFQVTSLHYHFPTMVNNMVRWSLYCAVTGRRMRQTLDWEPFYRVAAQDLPYRERLAGYAKLARERLDADRFAEFCDRHLGHVDDVSHEFFGTDHARDIVRAKVAALYPAHEVDQFTEQFWAHIQRWRDDHASTAGARSAADDRGDA